MTIKLTKPQADNVAWALDVMEDYWGEPYMEGGLCESGTRPKSIPKLKGTRLDIDGIEDTVLDDLRYRLVDQLGDMVEDNNPGQRSQWHAACRAWDKVARAMELNRPVSG